MARPRARSYSGCAKRRIAGGLQREVVGSGGREARLDRAIEALGRGDVLVLAEWDRATRSMMDGVHI